MKRIYFKPEIEIMSFVMEDIVTSSGIGKTVVTTSTKEEFDRAESQSQVSITFADLQITF